jgi:predicted metal-dependent phosphoesterase TrpH
LRDAAQVVGLAHPFRYDDPAAALELCRNLDAVERFYPYDRPTVDETTIDAAALDAAIETHDLLLTGGSDAHGTEIGAAGLDRDAFGPVAAALSIEP